MFQLLTSVTVTCGCGCILAKLYKIKRWPTGSSSLAPILKKGLEPNRSQKLLIFQVSCCSNNCQREAYLTENGWWERGIPVRLTVKGRGEAFRMEDASRVVLGRKASMENGMFLSK